MSTFDDNFPAKGNPKMSDRVFGFDSESLKNAGMTNQALYDLFKGNLATSGEFPTAQSLLPAFDLDNIRVMTSTAPDNKIIKSNVLDPLTGQYRTFKELDFTPPVYDGRLFIQSGGKDWGDADFLVNRTFNVVKMGGDNTGGLFSDVALDRIRLVMQDGDKIVFPHGTYKLQNIQTFTKSVEIDFGNSTIICSGRDGFVFNGTEKLITTVTADYTESASKNSINVASVVGAEIGDIIHIYSTELFNDRKESYRKGGNFLITKITGNTIFFDRSMPFDMAASSLEVRVFSAPQITIQNIGMLTNSNALSGTLYGLRFWNCKKSSISNVSTTKFKYNIDVYRSVDVVLNDIYTGTSKTSASNNWDGYGVAIESSTRVTCNRIKTNSGQHGITNGGREVSYDLMFNDCTMKSEIWNLGFGSHADVYNMTFNDCTIFGVMLSGNCVLNRCKILSSELMSHSNSLHAGMSKRYANFTFNECEIQGFLYAQAGDDEATTAVYMGNITFINCSNFNFLVFGRLRTSTSIRIYVSNLNFERCNNFRITNSDTIDNLKINDCTLVDSSHSFYEGLPQSGFSGTVNYFEVNNIVLKRQPSLNIWRVLNCKRFVVNNLTQVESTETPTSPFNFTNVDEVILTNVDLSGWTSNPVFTNVTKAKLTNTKLFFSNQTQLRNFIADRASLVLEDFEFLLDNAMYDVRTGSDALKYRYDGAKVFKFIGTGWEEVV